MKFKDLKVIFKRIQTYNFLILISFPETVIMKLFDRSVDLAQFPDATPLYPVCRAWIHNRPHDKTLGTLSERPTSPDIKIKEEEVF